MTKDTKKFISSHLNHVKKLQKIKKGDPGFNPLVDDTPEGTADIENLDDWVREMAEKGEK